MVMAWPAEGGWGWGVVGVCGGSFDHRRVPQQIQQEQLDSMMDWLTTQPRAAQLVDKGDTFLQHAGALPQSLPEGGQPHPRQGRQSGETKHSPCPSCEGLPESPCHTLEPDGANGNSERNVTG